jgi:hypothetical protein
MRVADAYSERSWEVKIADQTTLLLNDSTILLERGTAAWESHRGWERTKETTVVFAVGVTSGRVSLAATASAFEEKALLVNEIAANGRGRRYGVVDHCKLYDSRRWD